MSRVEFYKKKPVTRGWIFVGILAAFLMCISSILLLLYPFASSDKSAYFKGSYPIIFKGEQQGNAIVDGDSVYVPLEFMKEFIDNSVTFDEKSNSIIVTTKDKVVQMPTESLTYYVNETPVELHFSPLIDEAGELFVALDPIIDFYAIQYVVLADSNSVWIQEDGDEFAHGKVINEKVHEELLRLRKDTSIRSPYTAQVNPNESIFIESEKEDFYFVRKEDGTAGYLNKKYVTVGETEKIVVQREQNEVSLPKMEGPIQLTWEAVYTLNPNTEMIPKMPGVNIVSPTWFEIGDNTGEIHNLASLEYVHWAKKQGYQIWGLFSNAFDPELTYLTFKDFETRQKMIRQLLHYSQMYKLDGINLDIENVNPEHGPLVTQFVREATPYFHEAGLVVSMDITFIAGGNWSAFYERDKLASIVDYLIVMAYDEHWGSSQVAGSVSSFPWVESNLQNLLEIIPNEKLVLGVPLYTRLWAENDSGEVSSKALSMQEVKKWLTDNGLTPAYDEESGQNYAELYVEDEQTTYKVWLEDELSLRKRAELAQNYQLAGIASWSRYFADETAWTALNSINQQVTQK